MMRTKLMTRQTAFSWTVGTLAAGALVAGTWASVAAEEVRQGLNAPMILQMLSKPAEKPEAVMREMLRPDATSVRPMRTEGQVMPDGSVRYGSESAGMTVTLRNPCPPGDIEHEMMALRSLPGRGRK
jgi:hypothetical protein